MHSRILICIVLALSAVTNCQELQGVKEIEAEFLDFITGFTKGYINEDISDIK